MRSYFTRAAPLLLPDDDVLVLFIIYVSPPLLFSTRFPKDTADEQIAALSDEGYVTAHFWFHNALIACLVLTAFSLPKPEGGEKKA